MSPLRYFQFFGMIAIRPPILLYVARAARLWQAALAGKRSMPIKARASTFYRKAQRTAGAIVDLQNLLHVAVGGVARILPCIFGDGFGVHRGEPCNQTLPLYSSRYIATKRVTPWRIPDRNESESPHHASTMIFRAS